MAKKPRLMLPPGVAVFPKLNVVDVYQPLDKKGRPSGAQKRQFITYVRYEPEVLAKVKETIKKFAVEKLGVDKDELDSMKMPFKKIKKGKDSKEKEEVLKVTSGEKFRPIGWSAKNQELPITVVIGGGSVIALDTTPNYYEGFGGGINLYLNAYQVHKLVEGGEERKSAFEEAEGFELDDSDEEGGSSFGEVPDHNDSDGKDALAF